MNHQAVFEEIAHIGYLLLDPPHEASVGGTRLLVALRETPTEMHYDPEKIDLTWRQSGGTVEQANLSRNDGVEEPRQVCAGKVILHDRFDKPVYFFGYGGTVETCAAETTMVCEVCSPAPILEMVEGIESVANQLVAETGALLARAHARWGLDDEGFIQRLGEVEPLMLYTATVRSILSKYDQSSHLRQSFHRLYEALHAEQEWLAEIGQWAAWPDRVEDYLSEY